MAELLGGDFTLPADPSLLTFADLDVRPHHVTEGIPIEYLRFYRSGGCERGGHGGKGRPDGQCCLLCGGGWLHGQVVDLPTLKPIPIALLQQPIEPAVCLRSLLPVPLASFQVWVGYIRSKLILQPLPAGQCSCAGRCPTSLLVQEEARTRYSAARVPER